MMIQTIENIEELPVLPLWVNGHAFLTITPTFFEAKDAQSGKSLRRIPLCGEDEVEIALSAALSAAPAWSAFPASKRRELLNRLADEIEPYCGHLSMLLCEAAGQNGDKAALEVKTAIRLLRQHIGGAAKGGENPGTLPQIADGAGKITVIAVCSETPLLEAVFLLALTLEEGRVAVLNPDPAASGVIYALAELSARAGFPPGTVNLLYGREAVLTALMAHPNAHSLTGFSSQEARLSSPAKLAGKPFFSVRDISLG